MRYFVELAYHGASYHGWQRQPNASSVQQTLEEAMTTVLRQPITLVGAGRTDTGVHARKMVAHFDTDNPLENKEQLLYQLNHFLPPDIVLYTLRAVTPEAHARFDAYARTYHYHLSFAKDPFDQGGSYRFSGTLDVNAMNQASGKLLAHQDFECFSKSKTDVKTYICRIMHAHWESEANGLVFTITADRFLRNMVRAIVGTLLEVGQGKKSLAQFEAILASKKRSEAGYSVPAQGLYLMDIQYPESIYMDGKS